MTRIRLIAQALLRDLLTPIDLSWIVVLAAITIAIDVDPLNWPWWNETLFWAALWAGAFIVDLPLAWLGKRTGVRPTRRSSRWQRRAAPRSPTVSNAP